MTFSSDYKGRESALTDLFARTFAASEGAEEGALIGRLSDALLGTTPAADLFVYMSEEAGALTGAIIFSRMTYSDDPRSVFVLGPVAVVPEHQGKGVGQALLRHGLEDLRANGVDVALTYGDPNYYGKVGFQRITNQDAAAPFTLQHPEGWLGQSLGAADYLPVRGTCRCVAAFNDPAYW